MLTLSRKSITDDCLKLVQKQIYKPKQKNQYSSNRKFAEDFQKKRQQHSRKQVIVIQLPQTIQNNNVFRLHSNVQLPRNADSYNQLGNLNIDFYSYNYKINRIDRRSDITTVTFDAIDRPFVPVEVVKEMMGKGGKRLKDTFWELHSKKLDHNRYQILDEQNLHEFENNLNKPFVGYVSKVGKDKIVTQHRMMNDKYLACIGLDSEMLIHYAQETGMLPLPLFFAENDDNSQHLSNFFVLNTHNYNVNELLATNYNGQKYPAKVTFQNYYYYDKLEQCYFEYLFFIWEVDKRWCTKQRVLENHKDYFNLKELPSQINLFQNEEITAWEIENKRCGFKNIQKN